MGLCASAEKEGFQEFRGTGGEVRVVIVVCNYDYSPGNELTGITDGVTFQHMCAEAGVTDITIMRDDFDPSDPMFPTKQNVTSTVQQVAARCTSLDYFVFFYAGHGENVPDNDGDESDGMDEAFVTPGPGLQVEAKYWVLDDEFTLLVENYFNPQTKILCITDCCHSGSIIDVDTHNWSRGHKICLISAAQDYETSCDTGHGGILTISIRNALRDLAFEGGSAEYSVQHVFDKAESYGEGISNDQLMKLSHHNFDPELVAWPLPHTWYQF